MHSSQKHLFAQYLENALEYLKCGRLTSTLPYYKKVPTYRYYSSKETEQIYENQEFVFLHDGFGLMRSTFEDYNLFVLSVEDLLMLPNRYYNRYDVLLVWIDTTPQQRAANAADKPWEFEEKERSQQNLSQQFVQVFKGKNVLYFRDETFIEMYACIIRYLEEDDLKKKQRFLDDNI